MTQIQPLKRLYNHGEEAAMSSKEGGIVVELSKSDLKRGLNTVIDKVNELVEAYNAQSQPVQETDQEKDWIDKAYKEYMKRTVESNVSTVNNHRSMYREAIEKYQPKAGDSIDQRGHAITIHRYDMTIPPEDTRDLYINGEKVWPKVAVGTDTSKCPDRFIAIYYGIRRHDDSKYTPQNAWEDIVSHGLGKSVDNPSVEMITEEIAEIFDNAHKCWFTKGEAIRNIVPPILKKYFTK